MIQARVYSIHLILLLPSGPLLMQTGDLARIHDVPSLVLAFFLEILWSPRNQRNRIQLVGVLLKQSTGVWPIKLWIDLIAFASWRLEDQASWFYCALLWQCSCSSHRRKFSLSWRTKHIECDYHVVRERLASGFLKTLHVDTQHQLAHLLTKPLTALQFNYLLSKMGIHHMNSPSWGRVLIYMHSGLVQFNIDLMLV